MFTMDLKIKGKIWAGNIYQKFEAMCQEVDDYVSQDTVKYVENQVQTVGESVKKFCSDVVQDLLPHSLADPVKHEAQTVPRKQNDAIGTYTRSMRGIEGKPVDVGIKQSFVEQDPIDPLDNCHTSSFTGLCPGKKFVPPPIEDTIKEADSDLSLGQGGGALIYKNADMAVRGNVNSDMGVEENVMKEEQSPSEDLNSSEYKNLSEASLFSESTDENHHNGIVDKVSPATLINGAMIISSQRKERLCNSFFDEVDRVSDISSSLRSSELAFSIVSYENKVAEAALISSSSSLSTESYDLSEFSHANFLQKAEKICYDPSDAISCVSDLSGGRSSSELFPTVACDNKDVDMALAFARSVLSLESNDADTSRTDEAVSVVGSSGKQCCKCPQLEAFMSSLETGQVDDSSIDNVDPKMETIDLSDMVKVDESCVVVESKLLCAVSCRARKLRSYKKIIQDAFASRKRLTKEYEQLAILYGEIDIESSQHPKENFPPSIATISLEAKKSPTQDLCDSEWELL